VGPIRHLVDKVAQHVFADLGTLMLDRTVQSFIDADEKRFHRAQGHQAVVHLRGGNSTGLEKQRSLLISKTG
jgi:hypothetical protein